MFQICLFHFPFSCQHFRLELKCLILLRHLHFLPSTSSVLISASVTVSELSVKKVLGVFRQQKKPNSTFTQRVCGRLQRASRAVVRHSRNLVANLTSAWLLQTSLKTWIISLRAFKSQEQFQCREKPPVDPWAVKICRGCSLQEIVAVWFCSGQG